MYDQFINNFLSVTLEINPSIPPRTSLDLELDLKAQKSKLESLNDDITRLRELKQRLEQARDANDTKIATWAVENEEFKNMVETYNNENSVEDKKMQKILRKTSKEIYKLRKTKVEKNKPDMISFKYVYIKTKFNYHIYVQFINNLSFCFFVGRNSHSLHDIPAIQQFPIVRMPHHKFQKCQMNIVL